METRIGTCKVDGQMFTYQASSWAGKGRTTCDEHRKQIKAKQTRERVRKHRMSKDQNEKKFITVHIQSCNQKSYCGRPWSDYEARATSGEILKGRIKGRVCKSCLRLFEADLGGSK